MASTAEILPNLEARPLKAIHWNLPPARLVEEALARGEGKLTATGALNAFTGKRTGRSPGDKFMVDDPSLHDDIWWGKVNKPISREAFIKLRERVLDSLAGQELFIFDGHACADLNYRLPLRVINQHAWQNLFVRQLFVRPKPGAPKREPEFVIIHAPDFKADPARDGVASEAFVIVSIPDHTVLIGGTQYAGEMKKSIFGVLNYMLPPRGVLPMHCSANVGKNGDVALFFGLSGTGKTTLSADPHRRLIGDDEHGWSDHGVFNFEGGCYAKCIRLSEANEPQIWHSIRFGAVVENVTIDPLTRVPNYDDESVTENTRAAYPVEFIPDCIEAGVGGHPDNVVFLSYDAFGVLPPVARLTPEQAMYHFLSGYTSKTAGTEVGMGSEPIPEFSACFGHPFLPRPPRVYADMLGEKLARHGSTCWLINTGLTGGAFGVGHRMKISLTRAIVEGIVSGVLNGVAFTPDPVFGLWVPSTCPGVSAEVLMPRNTWRDKKAYDHTAEHLAREFRKNIAHLDGVTQSIIDMGGPLGGK